MEFTALGHSVQEKLKRCSHQFTAKPRRAKKTKSIHADAAHVAEFKAFNRMASKPYRAPKQEKRSNRISVYRG